MAGDIKDRVSGGIDEAKGHGKEAVGKATGDKSMQAEGKGDQVAGKAKQGLADVKDKAGNLVDKAKEKLGSSVAQ